MCPDIVHLDCWAVECRGKTMSVSINKMPLIIWRIYDCMVITKVPIYRYKVMQTNWKIQDNYPPRKSWYGGQLPGHNDVSPHKARNCGQTPWLVSCSPQIAPFGGQTSNEANRISGTTRTQQKLSPCRTRSRVIVLYWGLNWANCVIMRDFESIDTQRL